MPGLRLPMRKIRDVLRLSAAGMSRPPGSASGGRGAPASPGRYRKALRTRRWRPGSTDLRRSAQRIVGRSQTGRRSTASFAGQG